MSRVILTAFALFFGVAVVEQTTIECPDFVPSSNNSATIAGDWFYTQTVTVGIELPKRKCWRKTFLVSPMGSATSNETFEDSNTGFSLNFSSVGTPIDHSHSTLAFVDSYEPYNVLIHTILKISKDNYYVDAVCKTVEGNIGYEIDVMSRKPELSDDTLTEIKSFLDQSKLASNLTKLYENKCTNSAIF